MSDPRISVVIPTYNGSRYIHETIVSIRAQTERDWECIVVDDGSTDGTAGIVEEFVRQDARIRLIKYRENRKLPAALNAGFQQASGRYLTWIADDNLYRPRAFACMARALDENPQIGLVYASATIVDEAGQTIRHRPAAPPDHLGERNPIGWCFMYRASVAAEVGAYNPGAFLAEDYEYWLRIAIRYPLMNLADDLFLYRAHPGSLSEKRVHDCMRADAAVKRRWICRLPWVTRHDKALIYFELGSFYKRERNFARAIQCYAISIGLDPRLAAVRLANRLRCIRSFAR